MINRCILFIVIFFSFFSTVWEMQLIRDTYHFYWENCLNKDKNICQMIVRFVRWKLLSNIWMLRKSHTFVFYFSQDIFVNNLLYLKFWRMQFVNYFLLVNCSIFFEDIFYAIFRRVEKWSFFVWQICLPKISVISNKQNLCEMIVQFVWGYLLMLEKYQILVLFLIHIIVFYSWYFVVCILSEITNLCFLKKVIVL